MAAILQLILIWVWNVNETYIFIMKFKVLWPLLPENVVQFLMPLYPVFMKIIIRKVSWQSMSNFINAVLEKLPVNVNIISLYIQGWTNFFLSTQLFWRAIYLHVRSGTQKMGAQNQSVRTIKTQLKTLLFVIDNINRTWSFHFNCASIKRFCNKAFIVRILF